MPCLLLVPACVNLIGWPLEELTGVHAVSGLRVSRFVLQHSERYMGEYLCVWVFSFNVVQW